MEDNTSSLFSLLLFTWGDSKPASILDTSQFPCSHQGSKAIKILHNQAHPSQVKNSAEAAQTKAPSHQTASSSKNKLVFFVVSFSTYDTVQISFLNYSFLLDEQSLIHNVYTT